MKKVIWTSIISISALAFSFSNIQANEINIDSHKKASMAVVKSFAKELKGHLKASLKNGGPVPTIEVCNKVAPAIASRLSAEHGWEIGRTSLKARNSANAPDAWEKKVLEQFDAKQAAGEDPKPMAFAEVVTEGDKKYFRFMKAIPTAQKPCLMCHGGKIDPTLAAKIDSLYPGDMARGYTAGQVRGAFTIKQPL